MVTVCSLIIAAGSLCWFDRLFPSSTDYGFRFFTFVLLFGMVRPIVRLVFRVGRPLVSGRAILALTAGVVIAVAQFYIGAYWHLFVLAGTVPLVISLLPVDKTRSAVPIVWNEGYIRSEMLRLGNNPEELSGYFDAMFQRFVIQQNDATARKRLEFLQTLAEELKLRKDLQFEFDTAADQREVNRLQWEIQRREQERQRDALENKVEKEDDLAELRHRREQLQLQLEIARVQAEIDQLNNPPKPPAAEKKLTAEQQRTRKAAKLRRDREKLKAERGKEINNLTRGRAVDELAAKERAELVRVENHYEARFERIREDLDKLWGV